MKTLTKPASVFLALVISALAVVAQQTPPVPQPQSAAVVSNKIQLVIEGKVINVHDGDTVTIADQNNKKFHIRLQGIDAPELKQAVGSDSQQNLSRMVLGKQVTIYWTKVDKYRRTVGTIMLDGQDINIEQVKAGLAWHFKKYEDEQEPQDRITYAAAEQHARVAKLGLWQDTNPTAPGDWRQAVKAKRWGPPPPEGTIIGNSNSQRYHRPDCAGYRDMAEKNRVFFKSVAEAEAAGYKRAGNCPAEEQAGLTTALPNTVPVSHTLSAAPPPAPAPSGIVLSSVTVPTTIQPEPDLPSPNGTPTTEANGDGRLEGTIIGNLNSKKYHRPDCAGYRDIAEKNRVFFKSVAQAEAAGYKRAGNCPAEEQAGVETASPNTDRVAQTVSAAPLSTSMPPAITESSVTVPATSQPEPTVPSPNGNPNIDHSPVGTIVGNKNSKVYHLPGCASYSRVSEKNQVRFDSAEAAEKAGYKLAGNCSPKKNTSQ